MNSAHRVSLYRALLTTVASLLVTVTFTSPAHAKKQVGDDPSTLLVAQKTFATADADMSGFLSAKEADVAGIPAREFSARDKDKSGAWSSEDFLLYYHDLLLNSGRKPDKEFQNEVARIEAAREAEKAEKAEELRRAQERLRKKKEQQAAGESATTSGDGEEESISQKLKRAREALKDRSERAGADQKSVERIAGELAERARDAAGGSEDKVGDPADEGWAVKLRRARTALERRAKDGGWSREQLQVAERRLIERARAAQQGVDLTLLPTPVRSKYERALVALTERAQAGNWTREKYEAELADVLSRAKDELNGSGDDGSTGDADPEEGVEVSGGEVPQARRDHERALAALDERAKAGGWTRARYDAERAELEGRLRIRESNDGEEPSDSSEEQTSGVRPKVGRAQEALEDRARRAEMNREQYARITEELFERARLALRGVTAGANTDVRTKHERALAALIKRAQKAEMTRAAFEHERDQLLERARQESGADMANQEDFDQARKAFITELEKANPETRTKYGRALIALISRAQDAGMTRSAFGHERDQLIIRARQEVTAVAAIRGDFVQARKMLAALVEGSKADLRTKHERALNALITRAQKAGMTRVAFEHERDQLLERARKEAGAGGGDGVDAKGDGEGPGVRARRVETAAPVGRAGKSAPDKAKP